MFEALAKSLPMALGIAFSPTSVLAIIILLMSRNGKIKSISFLTGTIVGIQVVGTLIVLVPGLIADHGGLSDHTGTVKIILGMLLLLSIYPVLQKKKRQGIQERIPKIFNKLDDFGVIKIFIIGFIFSAFSLKNAALSASGAAHIRATSSLNYYIETLLAVFLFSLIASFTIITLIVIYILFPEKSKIFLLRLRNWLIKEHYNILIAMFLLAGIMLIGIGVNIHLT
ncbi:MAG: GAP family protein [Flavobacteriaceae bacterium]|nr:GAP family protein [Flavobacteriaceae bacterium]